MLTLLDGRGFVVDGRGWGFDCADTGVALVTSAIAMNAGARCRVMLAALIGRGPGRAASHVG